MLTDEQLSFLHSLWDSSVWIGDPKHTRKESQPYDGQDRIVTYLRHGGFFFVHSMSGGGFKCDGEFRWSDTLADAVERDNLRLEHEFEQAILDDSKRMTRMRKALLGHGIHTWDL